MIFVGVDWAEEHHDVCVLDETGAVLAKRRIAEGFEGVSQLHALLADHAEDPGQIVVGIETDRGLLVGALLAAGYQLYAINPLAASRYRERHVTSRAKSDAGDAKVLADLVRTDRHNHRPVAGDSDLSAALQILARLQQNLIWSRQRLVNQLRSSLREFYPAALAAFGTDLAHPIALDVLDAAPTPAVGRTLSLAKMAAILRRAGRERSVETKAAEIQAHFRAPQLAATPLVDAAYGKSVAASVHILRELNAQLASRRSSHRLLRNTRTPRSTAVFPDLAWCSAPGFCRSSETTEPATPILRRAKTMRGLPPSPRRRGPGTWSLPGWVATGGSRMRASSGPSAPSPGHQGPDVTTMRFVCGARPITKRCERWPIDWLGSFMAVCSIGSLTRKRSLGPALSQLLLDIRPWDDWSGLATVLAVLEHALGATVDS